MRGLIISTVILSCLFLFITACPQQIKQAKQAVQTVQQIKQGLPRPSSAEKNWHVIASGKRPGFFHSLEVINDCPVVVYLENKRLYVAQALVPVPAQSIDWLIYEIDPVHEVSPLFDLAQLAGKPVLVYGERESNKKILAVASIPQPQSNVDWQLFELPDNRYTQGQVAEIDGRLAIATLRRITSEEHELKDDSASRSLVFLRQLDATALDPMQWSICTIPLERHCLPEPIRLIDYDGLPAFSCIADEDNSRELLLYRAKTADPKHADDWEQTLIAEDAYIGLTGMQLLLHENQIALAYEVGEPPKLTLTFAQPRAEEFGFDLTTFTLADLADNGTDVSFASYDEKLYVGWSFWAQVFVFESDIPLPKSKDDFRSYFMSESPGKETVAAHELDVCGGQLVGTYLHENQPGELRFVAFEN